MNPDSLEMGEYASISRGMDMNPKENLMATVSTVLICYSLSIFTTHLEDV